MEVTSQRMVNSIYREQNNEVLLKCLVSQRKEYSTAKHFDNLKGWLTIAFALTSIIAASIDVDLLTAVSGLCAIVLLIATRYIDDFIRKHRKHAAFVQQYFDVTLYSLALGTNTLEWGSLPTKTDLAESIDEVEQASLEPVKNWYSDYSSFGAEQQVFYCQRENIRWDSKLRSEYRLLILFAFAVVLVVFVIAAFAVNPSFIKCVCITSWLLPIADFYFSYYRGLNSDIGRLISLRLVSDAIELMITNGILNACKTELINLQSKIMESRKNAVLIPDWFYKLRQQKHQKKENQIANDVQNIPRDFAGKSGAKIGT